jgi:hypothetical protein
MIIESSMRQYPCTHQGDVQQLADRSKISCTFFLQLQPLMQPHFYIKLPQVGQYLQQSIVSAGCIQYSFASCKLTLKPTSCKLSFRVDKFCMEPTSFTVKEESQFKGGETEFVKTKLMTRLTYTLDQV